LHVPDPAAAPVAVEAVKTQIPSVPPELHDVFVVYVEQAALAIHLAPSEIHPERPAAQTAVLVPLTTSPQTIGLQAGVVAVESQKQIPSVPTPIPEEHPA
jgi:hypothetical protein